jgi:hypothetical protein
MSLRFDPDENLWVLQLPGEWFGYTGASECAYITPKQLEELTELLRGYIIKNLELMR